ncbi:MAG: integrin [Gammaproteobacteria bacterium]|nr:integrin [Gammaproteobacteria bacterium]
MTSAGISIANSVANSAPTASSVAIADANGGLAVVGDTLTGSYSYSDTDNDSEGTATFRWLRNTSAIGSATSSSYTLVAADSGQTITFEVTPVATTGVITGNAVTSAGISVATNVANSAPTANSVVIIDVNGGIALVGDTLTGSYSYSDADNDDEGATTFRWLRNATAIGGATSSSYTLVAADNSQTITFEVTPVATTGPITGNAVTSSGLTVGVVPNTPPTAATSPGLSFAQSKVFRFTWSDVPDATFYRLLENPDGTSGFTQVGGDIIQGVQALDHIVPLHARLNAQYILQSCNAAGCIDSAILAVSGTLVAAIGYLKASNTEASDWFGVALSLSRDGNTLAVGAHGEDSNASGINGSQANNTAEGSGAVYIFTRSGSTWSQQAYLKASNTGAGDRFGIAMSLNSDGNTLAVGAFGEASNASGIDGSQADNTAGASGAVYVFTRNDNTWSQQAYLKASNTDASDYFGVALSLSADGNTLAVGAYWEASNASGVGGNQADNTAASSGAVYVFSRSGSLWTQQAYFKASNTDAGDWFGIALSLSSDGNTLAVGAWLEASNTSGVGSNQADNTAEGSGAAYIFTRSGSTWSQQAYLKASNSDAGDRFGIALSLSGDGKTLAVGAFGEDSNAGGSQADNTAENSGAVYIFTRSGSTWSQQAYLKASNTDAGDLFGIALSLSSDGNILAVGATGEASNNSGVGGNQVNNSAKGSGAVYVFTRNGGTWSQQAYLKASNTDAGDYFGRALSLSANGSTLVVGAWRESSAGSNQADNSAISSGAVYLY